MRKRLMAGRRSGPGRKRQAEEAERGSRGRTAFSSVELAALEADRREHRDGLSWKLDELVE